MANPLNSLFPAQQAPNNAALTNFQQLARMLQSVKNPAAAISALAQQNPQVSQIMQLCNGKDPKQVFIAECKNRGIDPNQAMRMLGLNNDVPTVAGRTVDINNNKERGT